MKLLALVLLISACEHDPRYEHHGRDARPSSAPVASPVDAAGSDKTVERHGVDIPAMAPNPKIVPVDKRTHRRRR